MNCANIMDLFCLFNENGSFFFEQKRKKSLSPTPCSNHTESRLKGFSLMSHRLNRWKIFFGLFTNYSCFQTENSNDGENTQWKAFPCKWKTFPCKRRTFPRTRKTFPYRFFPMRSKLFSRVCNKSCGWFQILEFNSYLCSVKKVWHWQMTLNT